jgi:hypothetical protein
MPKAYMKAPCENCPYRKDAPRHYWDAIEFEKVLESERSQIGSIFSCHKQASLPNNQRGFCAGWLLDQRERHVPSIALRVALLAPDALAAMEAVTDGGHEMFSSVEAMCRANGVR